MTISKAAVIISITLFSAPVFSECIVSSPDEILASDQGGVGSWDFIDEVDDICIWNRAASDSGVKQVVAATHMLASVDELLEIVKDYDNYADFFKYVGKSKVIKEIPGGLRVFQQLDLPIPMSDRYYTIDVKVSKLPDQAYRVSWSQVLPSEISGHGVETKANEGFWHLQPIADKPETLVLYYLYTRPGGMVFDWMANIGNEEAIPDTLNDVRQELENR